VVNAKFALTNDRAQVQASLAARDYNQQSLDAEVKKLRLGASTTANVLLQERNLAGAEDNLIAAHAAYAKDRAGLLSDARDHLAALRHQPALKRLPGRLRRTPVVPWRTSCTAEQGTLQ